MVIVHKNLRKPRGIRQLCDWFVFWLLLFCFLLWLLLLFCFVLFFVFVFVFVCFVLFFCFFVFFFFLGGGV